MRGGGRVRGREGWREAKEGEEREKRSNMCANRPPKKSQAIFRFNGGSTPEPVK